MNENKNSARSEQLLDALRYIPAITLILFAAACGAVRYENTDLRLRQFDSPTDRMPALDTEKSARSEPARERDNPDWRSELQRIQKTIPPDTLEYDMLTAHCFRQLEEHELAAGAYASASEKSSDAALKRELQTKAVQSFADAGRAAEAAGDLCSALTLYETCNLYCKKFGLGLHVPHEKIKHLKIITGQNTSDDRCREVQRP